MDKVVAFRARVGRWLSLGLGGLLGGLGCGGQPVRPLAKSLPAQASPQARAAPEPSGGQVVAAGEKEYARYRLEHTLLGVLGDLAVTTTGWPQDGLEHGASATCLHAQGEGHGEVLGLGRREQHITTMLDLRTGIPVGWTIYRKLPGRELTDVATQSQPGDIQIVRKRPGQKDEPARFVHGGPVYDPLGYLLSLRTASLSTDARAHALLDGQAYWQITTVFVGRELVPGSAQKNSPGTQALRFDARAVPMEWGGIPSDNRSPRVFSLWLSDDAHRLPLHLIAHGPLGEVRIILIEVQRGPVVKQGAVFARAMRRAMERLRGRVPSAD